MSTLNAKQVLSNLYGLMMEINYHRPDEDILEELTEYPDPQIEKHLIKVKQLSAKLKAQANKTRFQEAVYQLNILKQKGSEELQKLFSPKELQQPELVKLFRKFEELTAKDEESILEDQELLHLLKILKDKLDENTNS